MKRLYDFFIRVFTTQSSSQTHSYTYKKTKGNPFTNHDEEGNPLPPWVNFPKISPFDFFYREAGEFWMYSVWNPFWEKMGKEEQIAYLDKWDAPEIWRDWYSEEWQSFLHNDAYN
ncbi:unnamed protein product [Commensalibacter communis]|uniref:hypothetical protein n=1 Tax=Commensalibacter communis TaxID=2972786 RepID=UPI0022FFC254|nr:hypothetical protein [Commensalibacter communis]CAI3922961.1 unnamed protein product [Commensalibacter communis]